jgi:hypothetical protein
MSKEAIKANNRKYYETHREQVNAHRRKYYETHPEAKKASNRKYYEVHRETLIARTLACQAEQRGMLDYMKRAYGCEACGTKTGQLDYHHVDPSTKSFWIASNLGRAWPVILAEVAKCQVLCQPCHRRAHCP